MTRPFPPAAAIAIALGLGLGLMSTAQAQSAVSVYGLMDASVGRFQSPGTEKIWQTESGSMTTSFLGFKGTEDLGGGLKARFQIEHFLRLDSGSAGRFNGDAFWARNAFVGLQGAFGSTLLGRNTTPLFVSTLIFNAIGDSFAFSPSIRQVLTPNTGQGMLPFFGDTGWNNSVLYNSPDYGGVTFNLIANLGEGAAGSTGKNIGGNLIYFGGPFGGTVAYQKVRNGTFGTPVGFSDQTTWQLGGSYDLGAAKLYAQYSSVKTQAAVDTDTKVYGIGAAVPLGGGKLLAQYGRAKADLGAGDRTNKTLTVGYDYYLSKNTDVYAMLMNDKITGVDTANSVAGGVRLRF